MKFQSCFSLVGQQVDTSRVRWRTFLPIPKCESGNWLERIPCPFFRDPLVGLCCCAYELVIGVRSFLEFHFIGLNKIMRHPKWARSAHTHDIGHATTVGLTIQNQAASPQRLQTHRRNILGDPTPWPLYLVRNLMRNSWPFQRRELFLPSRPWPSRYSALKSWPGYLAPTPTTKSMPAKVCEDCFP